MTYNSETGKYFQNEMDVKFRLLGGKSCCSRQNLPKFLEDPYEFWDHLPCPPPWKKEIIFTTNWEKYLNREEGISILMRISKRCNITMPGTYLLPGHLASIGLLKSCDVSCQSAVIVTCFVLLIIGITLISYLTYISERRRKCLVSKRNREIKAVVPGDSRRPNERGKDTRDVSKHQWYLTLDGDRPYLTREGPKRHSIFNSYGNISQTIIQPIHGTPLYARKYHQQSSGDINDDFDLRDLTGKVNKSRRESHDDLYDTMSASSNQSTSIKRSENYNTFKSYRTEDENMEKVDFNSSEYSYDSRSTEHVYETLSLYNKGKLHDTLSFKSSNVHIDDFLSAGKLIDTPISSYGVRKWEYQVTLNRLKMLKS